MSLIVLLILVIVLAGVLPAWPYSTGWGYRPSGIIGALLLVVLILLVLRVIPV